MLNNISSSYNRFVHSIHEFILTLILILYLMFQA